MLIKEYDKKKAYEKYIANPAKINQLFITYKAFFVSFSIIVKITTIKFKIKERQFIPNAQN